MSETVVGIDVGGTFTDIAVLKDGHLIVHKLPSTPDDPSRGITQGISEVGAQDADFVHGSTVATNALLEDKGGRTALVTTLGFEDVLEIGRQNRSELYNLNLDRPQPLAPWELRFGLPERVDYTGAILEDLTLEALETLTFLLAEARVDGVAVSFLFSFLNPVHEEMVLEALRKLPDPPFISLSSRVLPEFREYERTSTVVVNSYVGPVMERYLGKLEKSLGAGLRIMQSSGGSITTRLASEQPVRTILSGPAGGVVGAFYTGVQAGYPDIITLDMGGTSTDVSLCPGRIKETTAATLGGYPISVPMIEIHTVGAGGGSIARIDAGGALVVGPQSAGADPGPACYGRGGVDATVTDANLVAGRIPADAAFGGLRLDRAAAARALDRAGVTAEGVIAVVDANMDRALRAVSVERGVDPRGLALVAFGGAGPLHACALAEALDMPPVIVPTRAGVLSAVGLLTAPRRRDLVRSWPTPEQHAGLAEALAALAKEAAALVGGGGDGRRDGDRESDDNADGDIGVTVETALDCRYRGQSHELTVPTVSQFHDEHRRRNGYARPDDAVEVVALRAVATRPPTVAADRLPTMPRLDGGVRGPAVIPEPDCTIWVADGWTARAGAAGSLVLHRGAPGVRTSR